MRTTMNIRRQLALLIILLAGLAAAAPAAHAQAMDGITRGATYSDGPDNRYLIGGDWLFRLDKELVGVAQGFQTQQTTDGWTRTTVPNAWNAGDNSVESMTGTVGWYRKDFRLPDSRSRMAWLLRFESVNYRTQVWLNGKRVGRHTGAYLPFELRIPNRALNRKGMNRLVVRVDNRRLAADFPPSGLTGSGDPAGGWWNYGGLLREVYLKRVDRVNISSVLVRPMLKCSSCDATVLARINLRNYGRRASRVSVSGTYAGRGLRFGGSRNIGAGKFGTFEARIKIRNPRLWSPARPHRYKVRFTVRAGGSKVQGYRLRSGIRLIKVVNGRLTLNGRAVRMRGVGLHEDDPTTGFAISSARRKQIVAQARELGATVLRSHYPFHPEIHELADRLGLMVWSEIPVYAVKNSALKRLSVRKLAAKEVEANILANRNHPSVFVWSIGNELSSRAGPVIGFYIKRATRRAKALDPTRPVGLAINGYPSAGCRPEYAPLDLLGLNSYFGWYPGPNGQLAGRELLSGYLDQARKCYRRKALIVSEFGAEANRSGPIEEKGTFEFQQDFVRFHTALYASKSWLSGALYWALQEFRVRPNWDGGNPRPEPPIHQKGVLRFDGTKKPAWFDLQRAFGATKQYGG
ncbi:MAG: beta galactosidase jelly roll domain-containing protein [Actinomycetota bacterium]|nr:beta galactosidase jelly roll domain-containing protein [Actinomycetota bacterium]